MICSNLFIDLKIKAWMIIFLMVSLIYMVLLLILKKILIFFLSIKKLKNK